jgi:hypothetical protein
MKRSEDTYGPETLTLLHWFFSTYDTRPDHGRAEWMGTKTSLDEGLSPTEKKRLRAAELREGSVLRMIFKIGAQGLPLFLKAEYGTYVTHRIRTTTLYSLSLLCLSAHTHRSWWKPHISGNAGGEAATPGGRWTNLSCQPHRAEAVDIRVITRCKLDGHIGERLTIQAPRRATHWLGLGAGTHPCRVPDAVHRPHHHSP